MKNKPKNVMTTNWGSWERIWRRKEYKADPSEYNFCKLDVGTAQIVYRYKK